MPPFYSWLADHAGQHLPGPADSVWTDTITILHHRYRTP